VRNGKRKIERGKQIRNGRKESQNRLHLAIQKVKEYWSTGRKKRNKEGEIGKNQIGKPTTRLINYQAGKDGSTTRKVTKQQ